MTKRAKNPKTQKADVHGTSSKFGQMIGDAFARAVFSLIENYLAATYPEYILLEPEEGKRLVKLEMFGGTSRQLDNVITLKESRDPVALFESKWLKDARHHNDKGAWILQLREVRKKHPTVRGAVANLAGYWTEGVGVMFQTEARITMVWVATDEDIYKTLQQPINEYLLQNGLEGFTFDVKEIRQRLPRSQDLSRALLSLAESGMLSELALSWLKIIRGYDQNQNPVLGEDLIKKAIDKLLDPLPLNPKIAKFEIALQIDTGNTIYREFEDAEDAMAFIQAYNQNSQAILEKITPQKSQTTEQFQLGLNFDSQLENDQS